jgi:N-hydroxyarylamine O-acetyltransferase
LISRTIDLRLQQEDYAVNLDAYFDRIAYSGGRTPTLDTLRGLHRAHMLAVPFENLDIVILKRPIVLDEARLFNKIVGERRGGFCYEQNGLFAAVLRELGFEVARLQARVYNAEGQLSIPFDHLALMVTLGGTRWLADVGFGDSFMEPLNIDDPGVQQQDGKAFRVEHDGVEGVHLRQNSEGEWTREYWFELLPRPLTDFDETCRYHQTSPESWFTRSRICSLATEYGRISISDARLITTRSGQREERALAGDDEFYQLLRDAFGIEFKPA